MKKILIFFLIFFGIAAQAQDNGTKTRPPAPGQTTIPKLQASLGGSRGGNLSGAELSKIVDSVMTVRDQEGNSYPVTHFRVFYKFRSSSEDHDSGERKTVDDMRVNEFYNTSKMSDLWKESIKDNAAANDEMIIDNIRVRLKNGKKMQVPSIRFKVTE